MANKGAVVARIVSEYSDKGTKEATKDFKKLSSESSGLGKQFSELGKKFAAAFAVTEIIKFGFEAVKTAENVNGAFSKMNLAFANSGSALNSNSEQVQKAVEQMGNLAFTSVETADALARGAIIFHSASGAMNNLGLAANVARASGMTLSEAMIALGKASEGKAVKSLTALGVVMPKNGTAAEKYKIVTDQLTKALQGQAEAYAQTHPIEAMKVKFEELSNSVGQLLLPLFNAVVKVIDTYLIPSLVKMINFLRENPKYLQPFADAWAVIVNVIAKVAAVIIGTAGDILKFASVVLQVVRAVAFLNGDKAIQDWAKRTADGLGKTSATLETAANKLDKFHMNSVKLRATSPIVVKGLGDITAQTDKTTTATSKLTAAQIAGIEALKKYGVTVKDQTSADPIELEAARQLLVKQGNLLQLERIQALMDSTNAQLAANEATARYNDLLGVLSDSHVSSEEVAVLAKKWGISQDAVVAYIAQVTGAAAFDPSELGSPGAVAATGWQKALKALNDYYDRLAAQGQQPMLSMQIPPSIVQSTAPTTPSAATPGNPYISTTPGEPSVFTSPNLAYNIPSTVLGGVVLPETPTASFGSSTTASQYGFGSNFMQGTSAQSGTTIINVQGSIQTQSDNAASIAKQFQLNQLSGKSALNLGSIASI
jgi:hypothetical protein